MEIKHLISALNKAVDECGIIIISGGSRTGKTWLIERHLQAQAKVINLREKTRITVEMIVDIANSVENTLAIDEAQLIDSNQILDVAEHCQKNGKALIVCSQIYRDSLDLKLAEVAATNGRKPLFIELKKWGRGEAEPVDFYFSDRYPSDVIGDMDF